MPKLLDEAQVTAFHRHGFVSPMRVLSQAEAAAHRRRFESCERANSGWCELSRGQEAQLLRTWAAELVRNPREDMDAQALAEHACIMAPRQSILYDGVRDKPAHLSR